MMSSLVFIIVSLLLSSASNAMNLACIKAYSFQTALESKPIVGEVTFTESRFGEKGWVENVHSGIAIEPLAHGDELQKLAYSLLEKTNHILVFSDDPFGPSANSAAFEESVSHITPNGLSEAVEGNVLVFPTALKNLVKSSKLLPHEGAHAFFRRIVESGIENSYGLVLLNRSKPRSRSDSFYHHLLSMEELYTWAMDLMIRGRAQSEARIQALFEKMPRVMLSDLVNVPVVEDNIAGYKELIRKSSRLLQFARHDLRLLDRVDAKTFNLNARYHMYEFSIEPDMTLAVPVLPQYQNDPEKIHASILRMVNDQIDLVEKVRVHIDKIEKQFNSLKMRENEVTLKDYQELRRLMNDLMREVRMKNVKK